MTEIPVALALALADLLGAEAAALARSELVADRIEFTANPEIVLWEEQLQQRIEEDPLLDVTAKQALVLVRRGQERFRELVSERGPLAPKSTL